MKTMNEETEEAEGDREVRGTGRRRHALPFLGLTLMVALLTVVGCAGSTAAPQSADVQAGGSDATVEMVDVAFEPDTVTVAVGRSVTWVNQDSVSHNAVADDGSWKTEIFAEGGSVTLTFDTPGTYSYVCTLHPNMKGTVIVR